jgi:hypothetical protein
MVRTVFFHDINAGSNPVKSIFKVMKSKSTSIYRYLN